MTTTAPAQQDEALASRNTKDRAPYAPYVPHDLKYSADFEDSLIQTVLYPSEKQTGIRVIPDGEQAVQSPNVRLASSIDPESLPHITEDELPLPLSDPRRIFASPISGINLTHPGGYLEGGPGLDPEMDTFPDDFLSARAAQIYTPDHLRRALDREIEASLALLRERVEGRRKAREKNEQLERELKALRDQHAMELKIHDRMQEEVVRKKEAKERRKKEKGGASAGAGAGAGAGKGGQGGAG